MTAIEFIGCDNAADFGTYCDLDSVHANGTRMLAVKVTAGITESELHATLCAACAALGADVYAAAQSDAPPSSRVAESAQCVDESDVYALGYTFALFLISEG